jgi:glyoxylase-like metal-dependent hydrolase (beta-lactamase superfamily II)
VRLRRGAHRRSLRLGDDMRLSVLPDGVSPLAPEFLTSAPAAYWRSHPEYLDADGNLVTSVAALLVERGDRALLIDAGYGARAGGSPPIVAPWQGGHLPESLRRAGVDPDRVEAVAFTHLHDDHIGWASPYSPAGGGTLFGRAEWLVTAPEWEANRIDSQGTVRLTEATSRLQLDHPEWTVLFDSDAAAAEASRRRLLDLAADATLTHAGHFADVVFGRVERFPAGMRWQPLPDEIGRL